MAEHFGIPVLYVRLAFIVGTWFHGMGVIAYLLLWRFLPLRQPELSPGLESATRRGLRTSGRPGAFEVIQTIALGAVGIGVMFMIQASGRGIAGSLFAPLLIGVIGLAVIWRQFDDAAWGRWMRQTRGVAFALRIAAGAVLVATAGIYFLSQERGWSAIVDLGSAVGVAVVGLLLILGPWITKLLGDLSEERRERVRSQERADVAAHLHDSVLQTLALIQKNPADAARLARSQERDLRAWLYAGESMDDATVASALRAAAAEIEDAWGVAVDVVAVGDVDFDESLRPIVQAAREATANAAKHSGVPRVDVYAEIMSGGVDVFVRDRGVGFDPDSTPEDRLGVRRSIIDRMERHGGRAEIRSAPGEGTEVRLHLDHRADQRDHKKDEGEQ